MNGMLAAERIRLVSSRSTWWCLSISAALALGFAVLAARIPDDGGPSVTVAETVTGLAAGQMIVLVLAALSVTSDYRFGAIRLAYQAIPARWPVIAIKAVVMAGAGAVVALGLAFGAYGLARVLASGADLNLDTAREWLQVAGMSVVWAFAALVGVSVGAILRSGAAAISFLLIWTFLVEILVSAVPRIGDDISGWMPFTAVGTLVDPETKAAVPFGPVGTLLYAVIVAGALLALAMAVTQRKDP